MTHKLVSIQLHQGNIWVTFAAEKGGHGEEIVISPDAPAEEIVTIASHEEGVLIVYRDKNGSAYTTEINYATGRGHG